MKHDDYEKNRSIMAAFLKSFSTIKAKVESEKLQDHGLYVLPLHRAFSFYFTRILLYSYLEKRKDEKFKSMSLQQVFRMIFKVNLPEDLQDQVDSALRKSLSQLLLQNKKSKEKAKDSIDKIIDVFSELGEKLSPKKQSPKKDAQEIGSSLIDDPEEVGVEEAVDIYTGFIEEDPKVSGVGSIDELVKNIL